MSDNALHTYQHEALHCLQQLIAIPALSRQEKGRADFIQQYLLSRNIISNRVGENVWACNAIFDETLPTVLLNSHLDTVPANKSYSLNPYHPELKDGKLYGLGSTDAGASLVSLLKCFLYFHSLKGLPFNVLFAASAEEEVSGANGLSLLFQDENFLKHIHHRDSVAIVGEPTQLQLAIAEKGLLVLDVAVHGKPGHAARDEGDNAIYKALDIINWFRTYKFPDVSTFLDEVKMTVTSIESENKAHNIIPAECKFTVDIRVTESYSHEQVLQEIQKYVSADIRPRGMRLRSSIIPESHPLVQAGILLGKKPFGSPTASDKALIPLPALKCGPGFSGQSHSADEFIQVTDLEDGVAFYIELLTAYAEQLTGTKYTS